MKWRTAVMLGLFFSLAGCQQCIPRKATPVTPVKQTSAPVKVVTVVKKVDVPVPVVEKKTVLCRILPPPQPLPLPVAPNTKPGEVFTDKQRILLMQDYIRSLQSYIKYQHETDAKAYQGYIQGCADPAVKPAPASSAG